MKKNFRFYLFLLLFFIFLIVTIIFITFNPPMLCEGNSDKFTEIAKQVGDKVNTTLLGSNIQNNNINANVDNPSINISNPDINIPSSVGTAVAQGASSLGIGAATVAGARAMAQRGKSLPPAAKAAFIGLGGLITGSAFVINNGLNTYVQKNINNSKGSKPNGPFTANSIVEEGDSIESVMNFLYFNLFICICIFLLAVILLYFYKNKKERLLIITWILLFIISYILLYLAYNLHEDFDIMSYIYQKSSTISVIDKYYIIDGVKTMNVMLLTYLIMSGVILSVLDLLFIFYIKTKVINENWKLLFIKKIFGERFYNLFIKIYKYGSKTDWIWIYYGIFLLIFSSLVCIYFNYNLITRIDIITEMYEISIK